MTREELLEKDSQQVIERCERIAKNLYALGENEDINEITDLLLDSPDTKEHAKKSIRETGRRFFLFTYPSDGLKIKGYISFVPNSHENPLLILLRGGNRLFGLMNPASDLSCFKNYTVIATAYRGGVSEGIDEFGGDDVNDVNNLINYFPELQNKLSMYFLPKSTYILGGSRGGMEMFLALARFPELQNKVDKIVSLSGLLNLNECIKWRSDMKKMFQEDFGLNSENEQEWIKLRNPMEVVDQINTNIPILILQGTDDIRVSVEEGYGFVKKLEENGNSVTYIEVPGGDHCLGNQPSRVDLIADWLENN